MSAVFFEVSGLAIANIFLTAIVYPACKTDGQRHVDNILKMLLGVLSVAGLIALAVPQRDPVSTGGAVPEATTAPPTEVAQAPAPAPSPAPSPSPVDVTSTPDFQIGEPSIDGKPFNPDFGMPFGVSSQSQATNVDAPPAAQAGYTPTAFVMPGSAAAADNADASGAIGE